MNRENEKKESYKVLLADDEQIERMALARRLLKRFGENLVILQAVDGTEAIKLCSQERCQIVIMDISMPERMVWRLQSRFAGWMRAARLFF